MTHRNAHYTDAAITLHHGDALEVLRELPDASVDSVVTDPPYGLEFMGKEWDAPWQVSSKSALFGDRSTPTPGWQTTRNPTCRTCGGRLRGTRKCACEAPAWDEAPQATAIRQMRAFQEWCEAWATECLRVLKPGGHLVAFGGTRTWHRLACAVEDAGFEVRDSLAWMYGQGFPKSLNVSAALDASRCRCPVGEWTYGTGDPQAQHGVRDMPDADVSTPLRTGSRAGEVLLPSLSEPGSPTAGRSELRTSEDGCGEPRLEGRCDLPQGEGQLRGAEVRSVPTGVPADGTVGRLHHGAPSRDGSVDRPDADPNGVREPQEPRPEGQPAGESGALPDQRRSQAWGGWPVCGRCSQPVIPDGLGTALKPAFEPIVLARKPLAGTVAANVTEHGTGALNIDATRIGTDEPLGRFNNARTEGSSYVVQREAGLIDNSGGLGRWPANVVLDDSQAAEIDRQSGETSYNPAGEFGTTKKGGSEIYGGGKGIAKAGLPVTGYGDRGGASRFFPTFRYEAKAPADERVRVNGTAHPTVKPLSLMRWLVRLVTPPGGTVLEPFAGSGTTAEACLLEGFKCIAIEREADYLPLIMQRIHRRRDPVEAVRGAGEDGGLFDLLDGEGIT